MIRLSKSNIVFYRKFQQKTFLEPKKLNLRNYVNQKNSQKTFENKLEDKPKEIIYNSLREMFDGEEDELRYFRKNEIANNFNEESKFTEKLFVDNEFENGFCFVKSPLRKVDLIDTETKGSKLVKSLKLENFFDFDYESIV